MSFPDAIDVRRFRMPRVSAPRFNTSWRPRKPSKLTLLISVVLVAAIAAASWSLVRNSSLVAVREVKIVGLGGYYDRDARNAVTAEAEQMTTMNVDDQRLSQAAAAFVDVAGVKVQTDFPHKLTVIFDVKRPVVVAKVNGRTVALSPTGEILENAGQLSGLPSIDVSGTIKGNKVTDGKALAAATVLGAAPDLFLRKVEKVTWGKQGLALELQKGVMLYFGNAASARAKWRAVAAVLADPQTNGLSYIDLRAPGRPAVGGLGAAPETLTDQATASLPETSSTDPAAAATDTTTPDTTNEAPAQTTTPQTQTQAPATQQAPATTTGGAGGAAPPG